MGAYGYATHGLGHLYGQQYSGMMGLYGGQAPPAQMLGQYSGLVGLPGMAPGMSPNMAMGAAPGMNAGAPGTDPYAVCHVLVLFVCFDFFVLVVKA